IRFAQNDVDAAKNNYHVGNFVAFAHFAKRREIDETWGADVIAERIAAARRYAVEAEFTLRVLDVSVAFARWNLDRIAGRPSENRLALRLFETREQLLENTQALAHFVHADQVTVIDIAVVADSYIEFQFRIDTVWLCLANIVG